MSETSLSSLVKEIGEALVLDDSNHDKAAYKKYVSCIYKIATNLILAMKQAGGDVVVNSKTSKQVKLVQQCVERVITLLEKMESSTSPNIHSPHVPALTPDHNVEPPNSLQVGLKPVSNPVQVSPTVSNPVQVSPTVSSPTQVSRKDSSGQANKLITSVPSLVLDRNPHAYSANTSHALTPMEIARKQNQSLMTAYKARMERLNRSDFNAFNYSLTIQRKMAENIAIAQAQEEELARKMQARNLRLEEEAAKRFATPVGMSKEEQEQRQIYKKILEYENETKWLKTWRGRLEANPEDPILISQLVQEILRCSDHPFTELLHRYQFQIYQRLYPLVANRHEEVDMVTVPLPFCTWPSVDDVSEIFSDSCQSPVSPVGINFSKDNKVTTSMSRMRREDSTSGKGDSLQDPEVNITVSNVDKITKRFSSVSEEQGSSTLKDKTNEDESINADGDIPEDNRNEDTKPNVSIPEHNTNEHIKPNVGIPEHNANEDIQEHNTNEDIKPNVDIPEHNRNIHPSVTISQEEPLDTDSGSSTHDEVSVAGNAKINNRTDLHLTIDKSKELEKQMSWERRQAQILMRQVTRDYNCYSAGHSDYDENNLDYLFDDSEDDGEYYGWLIDNNNVKSNNQNVFPRSTPSENSAISPELTLQDHGPSVDRSYSHTPASTRDIYQDDETKFQSLPINLHRESKSHEDKEFEKLSQHAYQRHLKSISDDIHRYLEKLLVMMTIAYEPLDTPIGKDQCAVSLEEPFFKPIWKTLLRLFRVVNHKQELVLACVMTKYADASLEDFKVSKKLWLTGSMCKPYQSAISELMNVKEHYTMLSKLECVVKVCRLICECVDDHYSKEGGASTNKKAPSVGADDLLPLLTYVIVQCATPQLSAECHAMTEFIHEGYMMGEEGYCLTSLRTALNYVVSMFPSITSSGQTFES